MEYEEKPKVPVVIPFDAIFIAAVGSGITSGLLSVASGLLVYQETERSLWGKYTGGSNDNYYGLATTFGSFPLLFLFFFGVTVAGYVFLFQPRFKVSK